VALPVIAVVSRVRLLVTNARPEILADSNWHSVATRLLWTRPCKLFYAANLLVNHLTTNRAQRRSTYGLRKASNNQLSL